MTNAEINRAVAERVMGWKFRRDRWVWNRKTETGRYCTGYFIGIEDTDENFMRYDFGWSPATSIADAIEAVEKWAGENDRRHWHADSWGCQIDNRYEMTLYGVGGIYRHVDYTLPLAICHALLAATEPQP